MPSHKKNITDYLKSKIRNIPDFPKEGIQFKDITTLLADKDALKLTAEALAEPYLNKNIDVVVGLEARGFLFGPYLAALLDASFVPIRKPGKLPYTTIKEDYTLEYGTNTIEMHSDAFEPNQNILIHDDLLATGGSAEAAAKLVKQLSGNIVGYSFIIELEFLNGRAKLHHNSVESLLKL